jgi:sulfur-carrier protein
MPTVFIPALLRDMTHGQESLTVSGATVGQVIEALEQAFPGMRDRLCKDATLRPGIAVVVDNQISRQGMLQPVEPNSEIHFLPAISGGQ